ncbi:MAG TPA: DOMON-like domain-containing protein [Gammaproteobacteria bacterium]|nr:DOMON-like domain-containing protein [Gammaproteobacteria bacterium]
MSGRSLGLARHPSAPCSFVRAVEVRADRPAAHRLSLHYSVEGNLDELQLPLPRRSAPADGLWQHTCFEAFVQRGDTRAYLELNFSPSTEWAIYAFDDYRHGMQPRAPRRPPEIVTRRMGDRFELEARVDFGGLFTEPAPGVALRFAVAAVLEDRQGRLSYWALVHPSAERPDFHHPQSFTMELPPHGASA